MYDVWKHTLVAIEKSDGNPEIRLPLLLHDIGKPHSYQDGEDGVRHFKGHPQESAKMSKIILERLGYEEEQVKYICFLVEHHDDLISVNKINSDNMEIMQQLLKIQYCDAYAHHEDHIEKRIKILDDIKYRMDKKIKSIEDTNKGER